MGRPPAPVTFEDIFRATIDRLDEELPVACADIAADLGGVSRKTIARRVMAETGLTFGKWILSVLAPAYDPVRDDERMRKLVVPVSDSTLDYLRRRGLAEYRQPAMVARILIEQAAKTDRKPQPVGPIRRSGDAA